MNNLDENEVYGFLDGSNKNYLDDFPYLTSFECKKWFSRLKVKSKSKHGFGINNFRNYLIVFSKYIEFTGMNPKELIDEVEIDEKKDRRIRNNPGSIRIKNFFDHLFDNGYSPNTCFSHANIIKGFYSHNGFRINVHIPEQNEIKEKIVLTKEIIRKVVINTQKLRDKTIILIMTSSGMSIEDILDLEYRHVKKDEKPLMIDFRREKNNQDYITFISSECVDFLKDYIKIERGKMNNNDKLFVNNRGNQLKYDTFYKILSIISKKTIGNLSINTKAFRRFFSTTMKKSKMNSDLVEFMKGHEVGIRRKYLNETELRELYEEREHLLTIMIDIDEKKINEMKDELEEKFNEKLNYLTKRIDDLESFIHLLLDDKK